MKQNYAELIQDPSRLLNALENIAPSERELKRQLFDTLLPNIQKALAKNGARNKKKIHAALVEEGLKISFNTFGCWLKEAEQLKLSTKGDSQEEKRPLKLAAEVSDGIGEKICLVNKGDTALS